jgi:hypothetical protein
MGRRIRERERGVTTKKIKWAEGLTSAVVAEVSPAGRRRRAPSPSPSLVCLLRRLWSVSARKKPHCTGKTPEGRGD